MDIFVSNLPFKIKEEQLRAIFEEYGAVESVKIIIDRITRQNKGFGFVNMPEQSEASLAIKKLNGFEVLERKLIVSAAEVKSAEKELKTPFFKKGKKDKTPWLAKKEGIIVPKEDTADKKVRKKRKGTGRGTSY